MPPVLAAADPDVSPHASVWGVIYESLRSTAAETSWRGWLILLVAILVGFFAGHVVRRVLTAFASRARSRGADFRAAAYESTAAPAAMILLTVGVSAGLGAITMSDPVRWFAGRCLALAYVVGIGWWLFNLIDVVDLALRRHVLHGHGRVTDQMLPLVRKALRLFLVIVLVLFTLENVFERDVSAWLAGLGIAGLAVTFAAQDTIKNFFGSITILLDRPFKLGDRIVLDGHDGIVEDIGFRSIRLRRADGVLVTIPNAKCVDQSIQNISRRSTLGRTFEVTLKAGATADEIARALEAIRSALADAEAHAPRAYFDAIRGGKPVLVVSFSTPATADAAAQQDVAERLQLAVLRKLAEAQIEQG